MTAPRASSSFKLQFISDNAAPICPQVWEAMQRANDDPDTMYALAYGDDPITAKATHLIQERFETDCEVFFVFTGTAANALALSSICRSYHGALSHQFGHVVTDEANAPEFFTGGARLFEVPGSCGRIDPAAVPAFLERGHGIHSAKIRAVTITQATEAGTFYTPDQIRQITGLRQRYPDHDLKFHMDGTRFANAMVALDVPAPKDITWRAGIDVLTLGGTKNGCPASEAIVFFDKTLAHEFAWRRKQAGQLASKMRYVSAPWIGMLQGDTWIKNAAHANRQASRLGDALAAIPGVSLPFGVETNAVYVQLPDFLAGALADAGWRFVHFPHQLNTHRFMCSWCTSDKAVDALIDDARDAAGAGGL